MSTRLRGELHLVLRLGQTLVQTLLRLGPAATQPLLQFLERWGRKEQETGIKVGEFDLFHTLYMDSIGPR